jgi:hypothetical protein
MESVASGRLTTDPRTTRSLQQNIAEIAQIGSAFSQLSERTSEINKEYFEDRFILKYWNQGLGMLKQIVEAPQGNQTDEDFRSTLEPWKAKLREFVKVGRDLRVPLLNAASRGVLSDEILSGIGERMDIIDDAAEYLHNNFGDPAQEEKW